MIDGKEYQVNSDGSESPDDLLARYASAFVVSVTLVVCLPFLWAISPVGDEGIWLHAAQRLLDGQVLYRDFFELHPPIGFLAIYSWLTIFGPTLMAARLYVVVLIILIAWFTFSCCRHVSGRPGISVFLVLCWVFASQGNWTQVNHHWLATLMSMVAFWALTRASGKKQRPIIAGLAASAATLVTSHRGALVAIAGLLTLLLRKSGRSIALYIASGLGFLAAVVIYLLWQGSIDAAFEQVILYPIRHYSNIQGVPYGAFRNGQNVLLTLTFPIAAILVSLRVWQAGIRFFSDGNWPDCLLFAIVGFAGIFPRPDAVHISFCAVLALPLLAGPMAHFLPETQTRPFFRFAGAAIILLFPMVPLGKAAFRVGHAERMESAAGHFSLLRGDGSVELIERLGKVDRQEKVFVYPYSPILPFLTKLRHPSSLDVFAPQYTTPSQYFETCTQVSKEADWVVFDIVGSAPSSYKSAFPAMDDPSPPEKMAFEHAIKQGFRLDETFGNYELRRRVNAAPGCAKILP